ncbi:hypothetical protein BsWGS_17092 [Bradybaena similaris]
MLTIGKAVQATLALALPTSIILIYWWYKNRSDEETYGKRVVTSRNTTIEVKVPRRAIGAVIGRHGSNIKRIQTETGARMHFQSKENGKAGSGDSDSKASCTLVIQGTPQSAQQAELMVHQLIAELPVILTEEIELPSYAIGRIIGKGGVTVREITSMSGAKIMIDRNEDFKNSGIPRTVALTGSRQQIDCALVMIQEKLEEEEMFRVQVAVPEAKKDHRSKKKTQPIKITAVPKKEETWDLQSSGCVSYQESLTNNAFIEVYVSAVEHPGHFWVQKIGTKALQLEQLQNDITQFACSDDAKLNFSVKEVKPGELVAARFEDDDKIYYRAKILRETPDGKVDLYFVDFGDNAYADKESIFRLRSDFINFPYQAIECTLAYVEPAGKKWSQESITYFEDLTFTAKWKSIQACVVSYKTLKGDVKLPVVQLYNTSGPEDIDVGVELVNKGYAVLCDLAKEANRI